MIEIPVWDVEGLYPGFDSPAWARDKKALSGTSMRLISRLRKFGQMTDTVERYQILAELLQLFDKGSALAEHLASFAYLIFSTNTQDEHALKELNDVEQITLSLRDAQVRFRSLWGKSGLTPSGLIKALPSFAPYRLLLDEASLLARHQLSDAEEALAADLLRSGGEAWGRLQEAVSSTLNVVWDEKTQERKSMVELRSLASSGERSIRKKAWQLELEAWKSVEIPLAAALNGVKGQASVLNSRRGWKTALDPSVVQARLSPRSLDTLIAVLEESLPLFRRYLAAKARLLGVPRCTFYDLFAPVGQEPSYTFPEAKQLIETAFARFNPAMAAFARMAFEKNWIHARIQPGKVGGAYCISLPLAKQPRILANFDGTFGSVKTLAHELGHAWHFWILRNKPQTWRDYPMTLAETASIFAETVLQDWAQGQSEGPTALFMLEQSLQDSTQVIVDILSRFKFEKALFERRVLGELSARELCELMLKAQKETYGPALAPEELHPYMWAVKGHYYRPGLAFYNYPYAFGQLFGLALYARAGAEGPSFGRTYQRLLENTGIKTADQLAHEAGFDLADPRFWRTGLKEIERSIDEFERRIHE
jgi:pepF/M3 family oligoendopeptidase